MADDDELVDLHEGMPVTNEDGEALGKLSALLIPEAEDGEEEEAEFLIVKAGADERLVPFEAVLGVGDGELILDATLDVMPRYPKVSSNEDPSDEACEKAYEVYEETAQYAEEDEA